MGKYLDGIGLQHFMGLIKTALSGKSDSDHKHIFIYENNSASPLHRLYVTGANNIRVDARADASSS